jgi:hypothetical protein
MGGTFVPRLPDGRLSPAPVPGIQASRVSGVRAHLWYDVGWPVATGLGTGLGLVAAYRWTGPMMFVVALAVLEVTVTPVAWSLLGEIGFDARRVVLRVAPAGAVLLLAVVGLADVAGGWTFLLLVVGVATSPLFRGWRDTGLRGVLVERLSPRADTRRRFDEIVEHGFGTPDDDHPREAA